MRGLKGMRGLLQWAGLMVLLTGSAMANGNALWQRSTLNQVLKRAELRVCLEPGYLPFEMEDAKGKLTGFDVELARHMAQAMGVKVRFVKVDWSQIMPSLLTGQCDIIMSGMTITPERNLWINFADPYMTTGQTILMRKALQIRVKSFKDLNSSRYTVVTKPGVTAHDAVKKHMPKAKLRLFDSETAGVKEVLAGKADAFVYDLPFNAIYSGNNQAKLIFLDTPFTHEPLGWGLRKGDPDFLNWLNHYLAQIKGDGTYKALYKKWFIDGKWLKN